MTKRRFVEYTPKADTTNLERLDFNLRVLSDPGDLYTAFLGYMADEFSITQDAAASLAEKMHYKGIIPAYGAATERRSDLDDATEQYRSAIYKSILPLYQWERSTNEFGGWLPRAFDVAIPRDGRHVPDVCMAVGDAHTCEYGICPIKSVASDITRQLVEPQFYEDEYRCDADKAYRTVNLLFEQVIKLGYIDKMNESKLADMYQRQYDKYFAVNQ